MTRPAELERIEANAANPASPRALPDDPWDHSIGELARALRLGELTVPGLVEAYLDRIDKLDPGLHSYLLVDGAGARRAAEQSETELRRGHDRGLLHGIPIAVKDLFATAGQPTTAGSRILGNEKMADDAESVRRLRLAGAIVLGKTNLNEFAFGVTGINPHHGTVRNPADPERIIGGSSSGSAAAVAAGLAAAALGTDTGGSIRIPAALGGIVGFKPTYGTVPREGVMPLSWSLDHVGPLTRTVEDARIVFHAAAGTASEPWRGNLADVRFGVLEEYTSELDETVSESWEALLRELSRCGCRLESLPLGLSREVMTASTAIMFSEAATIHSEWLRSCRHLYDPQIRGRLLQGAMLPASTYLKAQQIRRRIAERVAEPLSRVDLLLCPTQPAVAPRIPEVGPDVVLRLLRNTRLAPLVGMPALSVPLPSRGLPVGVQLMGPGGADELVLGAGAAIEERLRR